MQGLRRRAQLIVYTITSWFFTLLLVMQMGHFSNQMGYTDFTSRIGLCNPYFPHLKNELIKFLLFTTLVGFILHGQYSLSMGWASQPIPLIDVKSSDSCRPCVQDTQMKLCFENTISAKCV